MLAANVTERGSSSACTGGTAAVMAVTKAATSTTGRKETRIFIVNSNGPAVNED
jgi:hypothetical protein